VKGRCNAGYDLRTTGVVSVSGLVVFDILVVSCSVPKNFYLFGRRFALPILQENVSGARLSTFRQRALNIAMAEINAKTDLNIALSRWRKLSVRG
jgi:hypothetical protein